MAGLTNKLYVYEIFGKIKKSRKAFASNLYFLLWILALCNRWCFCMD